MVDGEPETHVYGPVVVDHATNPRNVGSLEAASGVGTDGNPLVDSSVRIAVRLACDRVEAVRFRAFGCSATIAAASMATELAAGQDMAAARQIDADTIERALGGLPLEKRHCAAVAAGALRRALDAAGGA